MAAKRPRAFRAGRVAAPPEAARLVEAMRRFAIRLNSLTNNVLSRGQLNLPQYNALSAIAPGSPLSMGRLTEALCVSMAAVTNLVDRLVELGLVRRGRDRRDRRVVLVEPTAKGRRTVEQVQRDVIALFSKLLEKLSPAEREQCVTVYERMTALVWELPLEMKR